MTPDQQRLINKLALWETPGFSQFIEDLAHHIDILDVKTQVESLKSIYKRRLGEFEKRSKFKQTKLPL